MPGKDLVPRPAVQPPAVQDMPPWARDKRETVTVWKWLYRRRHWTLPLLLVPALLATALVLRLTHTAKDALIAGAVLTVVIALFGRLKWDRVSEHVYAALSAAALALWLWMATAWGVLGIGWFGVPWTLALLGAGVIAWGFFWWQHKRPRGMRKRQKVIAKWDGWWQSLCWGWNLGGSKVTDVHEMGLTTRLHIKLIAGRQSIQHVRQVMHLIESGLAGYADIGMVREEPVKGHPDEFYLFLKQVNPLAQIVEWDPAVQPQSVHEPVAMGRTETGNWHVIPARCNRFTNGASRTGKSNDLLVGIAALSGCADDWQILIDLKGGRSARPVLEAAAAGYVITERDEARLLLRMLQAEILARAKGAYDGEEQLRATVDCPAVHLMIDEVWGLTSVEGGEAECSLLLGDVASKGKGLEVYTWVYTQMGSLEDSVRSNQTRGNLDVRTVYRVEEARHGQYCIPEYGKLDASKLEEQGTCYIKNGPKILPEQVRAPEMKHKRLTEIAAQNACTVVKPPLMLYCGGQAAYTAGDGQDVTWQEWWDTRWSRLDPAFRDISPQYQAHMAASPALAFAAIPEPPAPPPSPEPGTGSGAAVAARMQAELDAVHGPGGHPGNVRPPRVNLANVIRTEQDRFASALETAPPQGISPAHLGEESGRGRTWIHDQLNALVEAGAVTQIGRGRYAPVPGTDIRAAMKTIKDRGERLYREAKATVSSAA